MNYKLNETEMFADITDGTAIIINSVTGIYYGMNGYGTSLFENLLAGSSVEDIVAAAQRIPGYTEEMKSHIDVFLKTLVDYHIVIPAEVSSREAVLDSEAAVADGFVPVCNEYRDVQELLFADPIHEVEEDKGWVPEK